MHWDTGAGTPGAKNQQVGQRDYGCNCHEEPACRKTAGRVAQIAQHLWSQVTEDAAAQTHDAHPRADLIPGQDGATDRIDLVGGSVTERYDQGNADPEEFQREKRSQR